MPRLSKKNRAIQEQAARIPFYVTRARMAIWILSGALRCPGLSFGARVRLMVQRQDIRTTLEIIKYGRRVTW